MKRGESFKDANYEKKHIYFDALELCALDAAFLNPLNTAQLDEFRQGFPDTYAESKTEFFKESSGVNLSLDKFKDFLTSMAKIVSNEQKNILAEPDLSLLSCGHRVAEHRKALNSVVKKLDSVE